MSLASTKSVLFKDLTVKLTVKQTRIAVIVVGVVAAAAAIAAATIGVKGGPLVVLDLAIAGILGVAAVRINSAAVDKKAALSA